MKNHNGGTHQATLTAIGGIGGISTRTMMSQQTPTIQSQIWVQSVWLLDWMHLALWIWKMLKMRRCLMNCLLEKNYFLVCFDILIGKSKCLYHWLHMLYICRYRLCALKWHPDRHQDTSKVYLFPYCDIFGLMFSLFHLHSSYSSRLFPNAHTAHTTPCFIHEIC